MANMGFSSQIKIQVHSIETASCGMITCKLGLQLPASMRISLLDLYGFDAQQKAYWGWVSLGEITIVFNVPPSHTTFSHSRNAVQTL
ncbi:hypothetical protein QQP08_019928 [Theobroma cacao]|nr:hypothetical protein QQP08_019928 [Theobroma cacao]